MLFTVILWISLYFIRLAHPISIGVILILHTFVVGLVTGVVADNFIYSYILFLVILGGVLVLFIYITSLVSNETFSFSWLDLATGVLILVLAITSLLLFIAPLGRSLTFMESLVSLTYTNTEIVGLEKLYSGYRFILTLFLIVYLLYVLLVCVRIVGVKTGPLRKFN